MNIKKVANFIIFSFITIFIGTLTVNAASFGKITGGNTNGKTFKVPVVDAEGFIFTYDKNYLLCEGLNTSPKDNPYGRVINSNNVELTCTVKTDKNAELTLSLVDPNQNVNTISVSYTINPAPEKPAETTKQTTTAPTTEAKSKNANLKQLVIKDSNGKTVEISPSFSSNVYKYDAVVDGTVKNINIEAVAEDEKSNIVISKNASEELKEGENNEITITVTAEDTSFQKQYVLNIKKEVLASDATLSSLVIEEVPDFVFDPSKYKYSIKLNKDISSLILEYTTNDENAIVTISGNEDLKDGSKIKILVTAEDGTKKEYILTVVKNQTTTKKNNTKINVANDKNPLVIMILSMIGFGLIGSIVYVAKK